MKILITTGLFPPDIGGPATYSKILGDELPKRGFEVRVLSFGSVRHLPKIIRHLVYSLKTLFLGWRVDIIFAQDPVSVGLPSALTAMILNKKFLLKIVGDYAWEQGAQRFGIKDALDVFIAKKYSWKVESFRKIQRFVANKAKIIIVPSNYLKKIVLSWRINAEKIKVIYNSFDVAEPAEQKHDLREKFNFSDADIILISAGRLVPWKGFGALADAMADIIKVNPSIKLVIIGEGPEESALRLKIVNLKLDNNIYLAGKVSHNELLAYLKAGDIFVLNTAYEGFSHQILEAMAMGIPVVTTNVGGNAEIIDNGENGILIDYNDKSGLEQAVINLSQDQKLRSRLALSAAAKVRNFTREKMISETAAILNQC